MSRGSTPRNAQMVGDLGLAVQLVVVNYCFSSLFGTNGPLSDIAI